MEVTEYAAIVQRAETGWSIYVPAVDRHTWAPHLREVEDMARDLVQVMTDQPLDDITVSIKLPDKLAIPIQELHAARGAAADADSAAREAQRRAAVTLRDAGATLRDIAATLSISYQRVHQVLADAAQRSERLRQFKASVERMISDESISVQLVTNDDGGHTIITALGDELLTELIERLRSVGGYANVFVLSPDCTMRYVSVVREECSIGEVGADLTGDDRPGAAALIDTFVDYLELHPGGVKLDAAGEDSRAKDARVLESAPC